MLFEIRAEDRTTAARRGVLRTRRGDVDTPAFMPVGTQAAVKTLTPDEVARTGSQMILANTYHLMLRPGLEVIQAAGSIHAFMGWNGPILTDSGGFQVFSLANRRVVRERGVEFRSHLDGRKIELTPENVIDLQLEYGSDLMMPLDELVAYDAPDNEQSAAAERTQRWLARSVKHFGGALDALDIERPMLFGIAQGGFNAERRTTHARQTSEHNVDGFSIGGLSVGESKSEMVEMLQASLEELPDNRPRYLMGVGSPEDLWRAVCLGVDMFDCVHATRVARRGALFTTNGRVNITAARFRTMFEPVEHECDCYTCRTFSAAYLHHLFRAREMLGPRLATIHNVHYLQRQMAQMRWAIENGTFDEEQTRFFASYNPVDEETARAQRRLWTGARVRSD
jgi:queuine tRNA-ribosyltransferase